ncbi:MAG: dockerin type I repeat-containing protein [Ruminococcus sp.]
MKIIRNAAFITAAAVTAVSVMTFNAYADNIAEAIEIEPSKYLADNAGFLSVNVNGGRAIRVKIEKNTPDGNFMYYNTLLEKDGTYVFTLDSCEYNIDTGEYDSDFTFSVIDENDTACSFAMTEKVVADPGFSLDISDTQYYFTINSIESAERNVSAEIVPDKTDNGILSGSADISMEYIPYVLGDVNGDGTINLLDASAAVSYYAKSSAGISAEFTDGTSAMSENAAFAAADITKDMKIDINDAVYILRYYAIKSAGMEASWDDIL